MIKKIGITGLSGVIGGILGENLPRNIQVIDLFHNTKFDKSVKNVEHKKINLKNKIEIQQALKDIKPDLIIHLAAITHIDKCEKDRKNGKKGIVWKINVEGTSEIAKFCAQHKIHLIFLSTECVFDGKQKYFSENAKKNPINWYGATKSEAEDIILASGAPATIIRSVVAYHKNDRNKTIYGKILSQLKENKTFSVVDDQLFTPTHTYDIVRAINKAIRYNLLGVYHVAPKRRLSPYEFAKIIAKSNNFPLNLLKRTTLRSYYDSRREVLRLKNACLLGKKSNRVLNLVPKNPEEVI